MENRLLIATTFLALLLPVSSSSQVTSGHNGGVSGTQYGSTGYSTDSAMTQGYLPYYMFHLVEGAQSPAQVNPKEQYAETGTITVEADSGPGSTSGSCVQPRLSSGPMPSWAGSYLKAPAINVMTTGQTGGSMMGCGCKSPYSRQLVGMGYYNNPWDILFYTCMYKMGEAKPGG